MLERRNNVEGALAIYSDLYIKNPRNHSVIRQLRTLYRKHRKYEEGIIWNDKFFKIKWPSKKPIVSKKDKKWKTFLDFKNKYKGF